MRMRMTLAAMLAVATAPAFAQGEPHEWGQQNAPEYAPLYDAQFRAPITVSDVATRVGTLAEGLVHPWAIAVLPERDAGVLVTERPGRLRHVAPDGTVSAPIEGVPEVENRAPDTIWPTQAGLMDVKLGPDFAEDRMVYLTYSKPLDDDKSVTAAARGRLSEDLRRLEDVEDIFVQSPPGDTRMHYGSRIVFDGRGHAFITTGEHSSHHEREFAQHLDKTYGKVVRVALDGSIPQDNPFVGKEGADPAVWSYGHRNVQGAAMRGGILYTIEHGPAGGDELNMPLPARNYGWPVVSYGHRYDGPAIGTARPRMAGMEEPLYYWDPVIAPGDMVFYKGNAFPEWQDDILIGSLSALGIVRLSLDGHMVTQEERLLTDIGRVRDIAILDDGSLLLATDSEDGRLVTVTRAE